MGGAGSNGKEEERGLKKQENGRSSKTRHVEECETASGAFENIDQERGEGRVREGDMKGDSLAVVDWLTSTSRNGPRHSCETGKAQKKLWLWCEKKTHLVVGQTLQ